MAYEALYTRGRPKTFAHLIGQEHISNALTRAVCSDRLSHAYLLVGTRGTGKTSTARLLAHNSSSRAVGQNFDTARNSLQQVRVMFVDRFFAGQCRVRRGIQQVG